MLDIADITLFLGFPISEKLSLSLNSIDEQIRSIFITPTDSAYLQQITYDNRQYLGKIVGKSIDLAGLELLQSNIHSLLNRILPEYPLQECPLILFSTPLPKS